MQNESSDSVLSWGSPETQQQMKELFESRRKFEQKIEDVLGAGYYTGAFFKPEKSSTETGIFRLSWSYLPLL